MSLKAVIPMATITSLRGEYPEDQIQTSLFICTVLKPFKTYFPCQFKRQHVKSECCLFDVASNYLPTPRSVVHPSYQATTCN